ncbi:acyl-CoA dehydrogenase family protein [Nocardia sp. NPDC052566]|uniref:acyl-CoA dehydrogenase family protein n=1 Tax=Nocardia sp. NPDC052566 TaxID=3364330 RepID=UPI0037C5B6E7
MLTGVEALLDRAQTEAAAWDRDGLPGEIVEFAATSGLFAAVAGAGALDARELGSLAGELGARCTGLRSLLTVTGMVSAAVNRWGTAAQRDAWLPRLAAGALVAGFAVTEQDAGTDLTGVRTRFDRDGGEWRISGRKLWVTFGQIAGALLVLGRTEGGLAAALVPTNARGVRVEPVTDPLGLRGSLLANIDFDAVRVPDENLIAPAGFGLSHVVATALDHGRYTVAWGCVGMARACLSDAAAHVARRQQNGTALADHQLVRATLGRGWVEVESAHALCLRAADLRARRDSGSVLATIGAKYAAAGAAARVGHDAVQLLGAAGCAPDARAGRFFRDAKVMEIIEGPAAVAELHLGDHVLAATNRAAR